MEELVIKVSIILPIYNVEKYLRQCLDSCINQTLRDIEIICVNDGSTDNSLYIIKDYAEKDSRIKIINQENQGVSIARNNGFNAATGEYVLFMDSDDWLDLNTCQLAYKQAHENDNDFLIYNYYRYEEKKDKYVKNNLSIAKLADIKKIDLREISNINYLRNAFIWNKIYKREWLIKNNIKFYKMELEDLSFTVQIIIRSESTSIIDKPLYYYRIRTDSLTKQSTPEGVIKSRDLALCDILETGNKNLLKIYLHYYFNILLYWYDNLLMDKKEKAKFEKLMFKSFERIEKIDYRTHLYKFLIKTKLYVLCKIIKQAIRISKWIIKNILFIFNKKENLL